MPCMCVHLSQEGYAILTEACFHGRLEVVKAALAAGADKEVQDPDVSGCYYVVI